MQNNTLPPTVESERLSNAAIAYDLLYNQIKYFNPNEAQREFYRLSARYPEILWSTANRLGKTKGVGGLVYYTSSGNYPDWWEGIRFDGPVQWLVLGITSRSIRGSSQRILTNEHGRGFGTGVIPLAEIGEYKYYKDENECLDYIRIKHTPTGLFSTVQFFTQNMDWRNLMGTEFDACWADEQLDDCQYYSQFLRATASKRKKIIILSATPEMGRTKIFDRYEKEDRPYCRLEKATLWQATQYTPEQQQVIFDSYPENERPYRVYGEPVLGHGLVYNVDENRIRVKPFPIPAHWYRIAGIDFGRVRSWTAITWIAFDPLQTDRQYFLYDSLRIRNVDPEIVVAHILQRDREACFSIPIAWPRDGNNTEASTGNRVAKCYADLGANLLEKPFTMIGQDGKQTASVRAGCLEIQFLMNTGRFYILDKPQNQIYFDELRTYSKDENGDIPKTESNDPHNLDSMRYCMCSADRFAEGPKFDLGNIYADAADTRWGVFDKQTEPVENPRQIQTPWGVQAA